MRREDAVGFVPRFGSAQGIDDEHGGGGFAGKTERDMRLGNFFEGGGEAFGVTGKLRAAGVGEIFAFAGAGEVEQLRHDGAEDGEEQADDQDDDLQLPPSLPLRESERLRPRPPYQSERRTISERMTMEPSMTAARVMNCTSRFLRWPISWAMTPWSSSRLRRYIRPVVTVMELVSGLRPTAKALGAGSSMRKMRGMKPSPEASRISSTMLKSCGLSSFFNSRAFALAIRMDSALVK